MIRKYYFAPFNYLIKTLLANESLLALDPILAGGFPVALFNELKQINSAHGWQQLFNRVNKHGFQAIKTEFSDIDIYFLENNPIWHSKYQWLVANSRNTPSKYIQNNPFGFQLPIPTYHSKWVNSYLSNNHSDTTHYQIVKFPHASIEKCLNNFDLKICCIAWYNDYIYVHQSFEESFNQSRIEVNEPGFYKRSQEDIYARIFTAQRAYKYANRLNFKLSSDLDQFCAALYTETQSINLESDAPLLNAAGQVSRNPVPSSAAFQSVINYFLSQHEHYVGMRSSLKQNQKSSNDRQTTFKPKKKLTIGMVTYDDYDGVYFSVQAIRMFHPEVSDETDIVVIDNNPNGVCARALQSLSTSVQGCRYLANGTILGTAVRDCVFQEAQTDYVLCIDAHVLIEAGRIRQLIDYFETQYQRGDLLQGPLLVDDMRSCFSHFRPEWRDGMYGIWDLDERANDPKNQAFDIPMQGLGLFACHRLDWPGFNPEFYGFGGEEGYIHQKIRQRGGRTLCLPFLRWLHRFQRPLGIPYDNRWEHRIRNYLIGFQELGLDSTEMENHFMELLGRSTVDKVNAMLQLEKNNPFSYFDVIYCINPGSRSRLWQQITEQFEKLGILFRVRRFTALEENNNPHRAYALAHRAIIEECRDRGCTSVLVINDDTLFFEDTLELLGHALAELTTRKWQIFFLGGTHENQHPRKLSGCQFLGQPANMSGTHALAYHERIYDKLLNDIPTKEEVNDSSSILYSIEQYLGWQNAKLTIAPTLSCQGQLTNE